MSRPRERPLRILHVVPLPPPTTGIGVSFQHFIRSAPLHAQANWIINSAAGAIGSARPKRPTLRRLLHHARLTGQIIRSVRQHRVEVVHLHGSSHDLSFIGNGLSVASARLLGARTVWHLHEDLSVVQFPGKSALTRTIFAGLTRVSSALAVLTDKDRLTAQAYVPGHQVVVISPTCSPEMLSLPAERTPGSEFKVLFVGWLTEAKGIYDLVQVAALLRERISGLQFYVLGVGRSDEQTRLVREDIAVHHLENVVHLCGLVTGADKIRMFAESDVLFTPTHQDAFPVTVLEAMSAALPVVGTAVGGLPFMLEAGTGAYLSAVGDRVAMTDHLESLARDRTRRQHMGEANRQRFLERYHPDRVGQAAADVYERLTMRKARGRV